MAVKISSLARLLRFSLWELWFQQTNTFHDIDHVGVCEVIRFENSSSILRIELPDRLDVHPSFEFITQLLVIEIANDIEESWHLGAELASESWGKGFLLEFVF